MGYTQQVISSMGANLQTLSGSISFTLGEPVIATISTTRGIITQGFHQTMLPGTVSDNTSINFNAYPNPTSGLLHVFMDIDDMRNVKLVLSNKSGNILFARNTENKSMEIDFSNYLSGIYFIVIYKDYKILGTLKIIKQ